ncbi:hypothetical protein OEIGOIKO_07827 [Streptomyces chrestomyceticus JCM 4735]|uniref:Interferon-induced transmembrane protein n=1 Tax=Streptomyces chrestomyceticus JCM 4735 TaxID=1306181 RepID=A0A7U9Q2Y7_9ACTN|nr:CD225/dispanin family protein [Streptomyces chrestomyceticus]GCD39970.1 hypothetical protein OEIGOIKO_07827 [Streptomyces chrestomyceticus JCM 4735]
MGGVPLHRAGAKARPSHPPHAPGLPPGPAGQATALAFSGDGRWPATGGGDRIQVCDADGRIRAWSWHDRNHPHHRNHRQPPRAAHRLDKEAVMAYPPGPPGEDWGGHAPWTGQSQPPPTGPPHPPQQPQYGPGYQQYARPPQTYLIPAILVTLFCFLPTGVAAIVFATQVNAKAGAGDWAGAEAASGKAKLWTFISLGIGLLAGLLIILTNAAGGGY